MSYSNSITISGVDIIVEFDYDPGEPPVYGYPDTQQPGCPEEYTIQKVYVEAAEWLAIELDTKGEDKLIELLKEAEEARYSIWLEEKDAA